MSDKVNDITKKLGKTLIQLNKKSKTFSDFRIKGGYPTKVCGGWLWKMSATDNNKINKPIDISFKYNPQKEFFYGRYDKTGGSGFGLNDLDEALGKLYRDFVD